MKCDICGETIKGIKGKAMFNQCLECAIKADENDHMHSFDEIHQKYDPLMRGN